MTIWAVKPGVVRWMPKWMRRLLCVELSVSGAGV
jgi:hypothetical protein